MRLQDFIRLSPRSKADRYLKLQKKLASAELEIKKLSLQLEKEKNRYNRLEDTYVELRIQSEGFIEFISKEFPDCILCPPISVIRRSDKMPYITASERMPTPSHVPVEYLSNTEINKIFSTIRLWKLGVQMRKDKYSRKIYLKYEDPTTKESWYYVPKESMEFLANSEKIAFLHDIFKELFKHLLSQWRAE